MAANFIAAFLEVIGIALVLPLINYDKTTASTEGLFGKIIYSLPGTFGLESNLTGVLFLIAIVFFIKGLFMLAQGAVVVKIQTDLTSEIRLDMIRKYASMDYLYYVNTDIGFLNNLITVEIGRVVSAFVTYCGVLASLFYVGIHLSGAGMLNLKITILVLVLSIVLIFFLKNIHQHSRLLSVDVSTKNSNVQSSLIQTIYNFKYLKATSSFGKLFVQIKEHILNLVKLEFRLGFIRVFMAAIIEPITILFVCSIIFFQVVVSKGDLAEISVLVLFFYRAFNKTFNIQAGWQRFNALVGGVETLKKAKSSLEAHAEKNGKEKIGSFASVLTLRNLSYSYGVKRVLHNINMAIEKNKSIGIVGESGAGKTTLFDLMTGLLIAQSGEIKMSNIDYRAMDKKTLRSLIGYVTQEPVIFNDTIANNITFWECNINQDGCFEKIQAAAKMAYCDEFIRDTEKGYKTVLGDKGVKLSGGQKQRIAIARELFKNTEILIFDEATSSLDTASEHFIQKSIKELKGSKTMIIIAHRLSTIRDCDYIYVLAKGQIVEEGSFKELYKKEEGIFRKMCIAQRV